MRFGSLFSGVGGFDLGFERAGLECAWQVEKDGDCNRVLTRRFPLVERYADVSDVGKLATTDVICGGFPCQDLSVAGKRKGLAGERSGLWFEFLRIIESNLPRFIVVENVPGLLSSDESRDFAAILRGLVECGYCLAWRVLDAQFYGVAQRRRRVFIVGSLGDGSCAQILFEPESVSWNPPSRREAGQRIANAVDGSPYADRGANESRLIDVCGAVSSKWAKGSGGPAGDEAYNLVAATLDQRGRGPTDSVMMNLQLAHALRSEGADASEDGTGRGTPLVAFTLHGSDKTVSTASKTDIAGSVRTKAPGSIENSSTTIVAFSSKDHGADAGEISPTLRSQNFDKSHINGGEQVAIAFHENKSGQLSEADVLGLRSGASHSYQGVGGNFGVRRLTPRECERLQSFPDDFTRWDAEGKEISDSARYRMLGNAVCVNVAEWIGRQIQKII